MIVEGRALEEYESNKEICSCLFPKEKSFEDKKNCYIEKTKERIMKVNKNKCSIYSYTFDVDFIKTDENKWVSNEGPLGLCRVINVYTIERNKDNVLWTYTHSVVDVGSLQKECKKIQPKTKIYSSDIQISYPLQCDRIYFGAF